MAVNVENYGSQIGGETEDTTATGSVFTKFYSILTSIDKTFKKLGNLAIGNGLKDLVGNTGESPNPLKGGNEAISSSFKGVPVMTKNTAKLNRELESLFSNLSSGEEATSTFKSMGDQLETLTRHFNIFDESAKSSIDKLRETGEVSKDLESIFKKVSKELKNVSQENLKILTENLGKTKKTTKSYFLEMSGIVAASVGAVTAIMAPLVLGGLDQQKQIIELSRATDSLLSSQGNQEVFSRVTRNMSTMYGVELQEVRNLFADAASDLGLSYSKDFEKGFRSVNPELEHYVKQSLILKKTADVEDKSLRGLVKAVKTVGVSSKESSNLVTIFTNSLVSLRANNRFTKQDVEEIATSMEEVITSLGFAAGWEEKEIGIAQTQFTNFINWMTDKAGDGGKDISKMFMKSFTSLDAGSLLMNVTKIDPVTMRELVSTNNFAPIIEQFAVNMDQFNEKIDSIRKEYRNRGIGNVATEVRIESEIRAIIPEASEKDVRSFKDMLTQMKKSGGFVKQYGELDLGKPIPEASKKIEEMYSNLAGLLQVLNGLKNKFLDVFGGPVVEIIYYFAQGLGKVATFLLDIISLLPDFLKGVAGIIFSILATVGVGSALSSIFNLGTAFKALISPFGAFIKYISGGLLGGGTVVGTGGVAGKIVGTVADAGGGFLESAAANTVGEVAGGAAMGATKMGWLKKLMTNSWMKSIITIAIPLLTSPLFLLGAATLGWLAYKAYDTYKPVTDTTGRDQQIPHTPGGFHDLDTSGLRQKKWTEDWSDGRYVNKWQDARESFFKTISEASTAFIGAVVNIYNIFKEYVLDPIYDFIKNTFSSLREKILGPPEIKVEDFPRKKGWFEGVTDKVKDYVGLNDFKIPQDRFAIKDMAQWTNNNWGSPNLALSKFPGTEGWLSSGGFVNPSYALKSFQGLTPFSGSYQPTVPSTPSFSGSYQPAITPTSAVTTLYPELKAEYTPVNPNKESSLTDKEVLNVLKQIASNTITPYVNKSYNYASPRNITENEGKTLADIDLADRRGMG